MNKLQHLQQQVAAHMAAKAAWSKVELGHAVDRTVVYEALDYHPDADAAMQLLADVLPLLEAAAIMYSDTPPFAGIDEIDYQEARLETEVAKLLEEVEE